MHFKVKLLNTIYRSCYWKTPLQSPMHLIHLKILSLFHKIFFPLSLRSTDALILSFMDAFSWITQQFFLSNPLFLWATESRIRWETITEYWHSDGYTAVFFSTGWYAFSMEYFSILFFLLSCLGVFATGQCFPLRKNRTWSDIKSQIKPGTAIGLTTNMARSEIGPLFD